MKYILFIGLLLLGACSKNHDIIAPVAINKPKPPIVIDTLPVEPQPITLFSSLEFSSEPSAVVCVGSDLTKGTAISTPYPELLQSLLTSNGVTNATVYNKGVRRAQWDYLTSLIDSDVTPNYIAPGKNIAVAWEIASDVYQNRTSVQIYYDHFKAYCDTLHRAGWKVIAVTVPYRNIYYMNNENWTQSSYDSTEYTGVINQLNDLIRTNYATFADGLADLSADIRLNEYNELYFQPNHFDLTTEGNQIVADIVLESLQSN